MQILLILNDPPYGAEQCYNGLRLALALIKNEPATNVTIFLMADAVVFGKDRPEDPRRLLQCRAHAEGSGRRQRPNSVCAAPVWTHAALPTPR